MWPAPVASASCQAERDRFKIGPTWRWWTHARGSCLLVSSGNKTYIKSTEGLNGYQQVCIRVPLNCHFQHQACLGHSISPDCVGMIFADTPIPEVRATSDKSELTPGKLCWAKLSRCDIHRGVPSHLRAKSAQLAQCQCDCARQIVGTSLHRYPWWPALVIDRQDQRIPQSEWRSTQTATPVLFFGTAEFSWIDASRNVSPWETEKLSRAVKDKSPEFKRVRSSSWTRPAGSGAFVSSHGVALRHRCPAPFSQRMNHDGNNLTGQHNMPMPLMSGLAMLTDLTQRMRCTFAVNLKNTRRDCSVQSFRTAGAARSHSLHKHRQPAALILARGAAKSRLLRGRAHLASIEANTPWPQKEHLPVAHGRGATTALPRPPPADRAAPARPRCPLELPSSWRPRRQSQPRRRDAPSRAPCRPRHHATPGPAALVRMKAIRCAPRIHSTQPRSRGASCRRAVAAAPATAPRAPEITAMWRPLKLHRPPDEGPHPAALSRAGPTPFATKRHGSLAHAVSALQVHRRDREPNLCPIGLRPPRESLSDHRAALALAQHTQQTTRGTGGRTHHSHPTGPHSCARPAQERMQDALKPRGRIRSIGRRLLTTRACPVAQPPRPPWCQGSPRAS